MLREDTSDDEDFEIDDIIDVSLFQCIENSDHCGGDLYQKCYALERISEILNYFDWLMISSFSTKCYDPLQAFTSFCDRVYSKRALLNDYIHFVEHHKDPDSVEEVKSRLDHSCGLPLDETCVAEQHINGHVAYEPQRSTKQDYHILSKRYIDRVLSIHRIIHHRTSQIVSSKSRRPSFDSPRDMRFTCRKPT